MSIRRGRFCNKVKEGLRARVEELEESEGGRDEGGEMSYGPPFILEQEPLSSCRTKDGRRAKGGVRRRTKLAINKSGLSSNQITRTASCSSTASVSEEAHSPVLAYCLKTRPGAYAFPWRHHVHSTIIAASSHIQSKVVQYKAIPTKYMQERTRKKGNMSCKRFVSPSCPRGALMHRYGHPG